MSDLRERFEAKYEPDPTTGCWLWFGARQGRGYGTMTIERRTVAAHRIAYELFRGPIPPGLYIDHLCRTPACVNPDHMEAVTNGENTLRGSGPTARNATATHCKRGHELTPENVYPRAGGRWRECRTCMKLHSANLYERRKAAARGSAG